MKKIAVILFAILMLTACGNNHKQSSTDRLAEKILNEYPNLNNSAKEYDMAVRMAQSEAKSWVGTVPTCLDEESFFFVKCFNDYGQIYAIFQTPLGYAYKKDSYLSLEVYVLVPVDYQTAAILTNDNPSILLSNNPVHQYVINGKVVNYDPSDLLDLCDDRHEINLGCLILGPSTISVFNP